MAARAWKKPARVMATTSVPSDVGSIALLALKSGNCSMNQAVHILAPPRPTMIPSFSLRRSQRSMTTPLATSAMLAARPFPKPIHDTSCRDTPAGPRKLEKRPCQPSPTPAMQCRGMAGGVRLGA